MNSPVDPSLFALALLLSLVISLALYVWTSLALAAVFRKMGDAPWKGWVPLVNVATLLAWGGFSPWLVLLGLIPGLGAIVVFVLLVVSLHRINPGFGYGTGMTVLGALLFVVWASIVGFGPARWLGARAPGWSPAAAPAAPQPSAATVAAPAAFPGAFPGASFPVAPPLPTAPAAADAPQSDPDPLVILGEAAAFAPRAPQTAPSAPWTPPDTSTTTPPPAASPRGSAAGLSDAPASVVTGPAPAVAPAASDSPVDDSGWPSAFDEVSAIVPAAFPPSAAAGRDHIVPPVTEDDAPIAFVPGRRATTVPGTPEPPASADLAVVPELSVTRMPAVPVAAVTAVPNNAGTDAPPAPLPARTLRPAEPHDPDAFPEMSGEVSAVIGAPAAGSPRSALNAVSAQLRRQEPSAAPVARHDDDGDIEDLDQTVITRRAQRAKWQLVAATGSPVPLTAEVIILGRRPAADPVFPTAQLIAVHDDARTVSKTHARLELRGETWIVTDLGSTNGVLVRTLMGDEVEVEPGGALDAGERFFLGDEEFYVQHIGD